MTNCKQPLGKGRAVVARRSHLYCGKRHNIFEHDVVILAVTTNVTAWTIAKKFGYNWILLFSSASKWTQKCTRLGASDFECGGETGIRTLGGR